jgi:hypothetical protein
MPDHNPSGAMQAVTAHISSPETALLAMSANDSITRMPKAHVLLHSVPYRYINLVPASGLVLPVPPARNIISSQKVRPAKQENSLKPQMTFQSIICSRKRLAAATAIKAMMLSNYPAPQQLSQLALMHIDKTRVLALDFEVDYLSTCAMTLKDAVSQSGQRWLAPADALHVLTSLVCPQRACSLCQLDSSWSALVGPRWHARRVHVGILRLCLWRRCQCRQCYYYAACPRQISAGVFRREAPHKPVDQVTSRSGAPSPGFLPIVILLDY